MIVILLYQARGFPAAAYPSIHIRASSCRFPSCGSRIYTASPTARRTGENFNEPFLKGLYTRDKKIFFLGSTTFKLSVIVVHTLKL